MLEFTSASAEFGLGTDFSEVYKSSTLCQNNEEIVQKLSIPSVGSKNLHFHSRFSLSGWGQYKSCLWKQQLSYWRSPSYNLTHFIFAFMSSLIFGLLFWKHGRNIKDHLSIFTVSGSMFSAALFLGINNCSSVFPIIATERAIVCREKFVGMYSPWAYSFAQVMVQIPYLLTMGFEYGVGGRGSQSLFPAGEPVGVLAATAMFNKQTI